MQLNCPKRPHCFELRAVKRGERSWYFSCEAPVDMQEWADAIALALSGHAPSLRSLQAVSVTEPLPPDLFAPDTAATDAPAPPPAAAPAPNRTSQQGSETKS